MCARAGAALGPLASCCHRSSCVCSPPSPVLLVGRLPIGYGCARCWLFAGILQRREYLRKVSRFLDAEEASGSNPLSPTSESLRIPFRYTENVAYGKARGSLWRLRYTGSTPTRRHACTLGVFGILHLRLVSFEGVFHGAGSRVSRIQAYISCPFGG